MIDKIDLAGVKHWVWEHAYETKSDYNDGWTARTHKKKLWELKCMLDDIYPTLPTFAGEEEWEKERTWEKLKK